MYIKYPCPYYVNTPMQNIVPSPALSPSMQKCIHEPSDVLGFSEDYNCNSPTPGPHQNWIEQPFNTFLILGDQNSSFYMFPYESDPETEIVIKGRYPYARYFSFNVSGVFSLKVGSAVDHEIIPDPGSTNPFLPGANWDAKNRNYTLKIRFTAPPEGSNHFVPGAGNNIIYAGTLENGEPNTHGIFTLRIYVPSIGYDKTGGVGLPLITYCSTRKDKGHAGFQNTSQHNNNKQNYKYFEYYNNFNNFASSYIRNNDKLANNHSCDLTWSRLLPTLDQPEANTVYTISSQIDRDPCQLLFIRWKSPTFPDTYHNIGIAGDEDMRYWSMSFVTPIGLLAFYTISDYQTIIDKMGYVNLVISFGAPRPSGVTPENGFTWVDASHLPLVPLFLIYRNNQISPNFPYTAKNVLKNEIVSPQEMGEYYPCGKYVNSVYFYSCYDNDSMKND